MDQEERDALESFLQELEAAKKRHEEDPPLDQLRAAQAGALPEELQKSVEAHLKQSEWSRTLVEGVDEIEAPLDPKMEDRILTRIRKRAVAPPRQSWRFFWVPAVTVGALALLMFFLLRTQSSQPTPLTAAARPAATTPISAPDFRLLLTKPDVKLTASAMVVRSANAGSRFLEDSIPAFKAYRAGSYADAEKAFTKLESRYPNSVELFFYLGISRLFLNDSRGAIAALQSARKLSDDSFAADITWYLAVAHEHVGAYTQTHAELDALCRGNSAYAAQACKTATEF
jgi:tetratricopeptide (TPR) repeat protein